MDLKQLKEWWLHVQAEHPTFAHLVVVAEGAALGAIADILTNGLDFSKDGLKHAVTIIGTTVFIAVRNYLKDNVKNLKAQQVKKSETT